MRCVIISDDCDMAEMLRAELCGKFSVSVVTECGSAAADLIIVDLDSAKLPKKYSGRIVTFSRKEKDAPNFIIRPFLISDFLAKCENPGEPVLLDEINSAVTVFGRSVTLTDTEYRLFCTMYENVGSYVASDTLRKTVWGEEVSDGLLNVYIHYLKNKIENGRKLIFSKRNVGYALILN